MNVVFDSMGTLFRLTPLHERIGVATTEAWFERILHSAATLTILGEFVPFDELARATLSTTVAKLGLVVDEDDVFAELKRLPAAPDAHEALERAGRAFVLTNGGRDGGQGLLEHAGLSRLVERVFGVDEVQDRYSTVTVFARLRGWSTFRPRRRAIRYASSCNGTTARAACRNAGDFGT